MKKTFKLAALLVSNLLLASTALLAFTACETEDGRTPVFAQDEYQNGNGNEEGYNANNGNTGNESDLQKYVPTLDYPEPSPDPAPTPSPEPTPPPEPVITTVTIAAGGDVTWGGDNRWMGYRAFWRIYNRENGDLSFFLRNVRDIFYAADIAVVNLEGTFTYETQFMPDRTWAFRAPPHIARAFTYGAVDIVSIANNHTFDFYEQGFLDTLAALEAENIAYFGNEFNTIIEINGINVGFFGFLMWHDTPEHRANIVAAITDLQERGAQLIIAYHHWGEMAQHRANAVQQALGHFTIESGAHLVLGAHPHRIQGIGMHNDRFIVYSLSDFSFAGHANPPDQDSFIFQQTFTFIDGVLQDDNDIHVIPIFLSNTRGANDFQPTPVHGHHAERIMERLRNFSRYVNDAETQRRVEEYLVVR